ncbi:MAG TPA: YdcF family protein [Gemmatimonadaceae bacterium]|nr:YdcF family protein [Gemmatimonadaceae bacterium]
MANPVIAPPSTQHPRASRPATPREIIVLRTVLGAALGVLGWMALAMLGGTLKAEWMLLPVVPSAAIVGALVANTPARRIFWACAALIIAAFALVAFTPFTRALPIEPLIRHDHAPRVGDPVVVLSGEVTRDSLLGPEALDRLLAGLELLAADTGSALVVTRSRRHDAARTSAARDQRELRALVDRPFPLLAADSVYTTRDEAVQVWKLLRPRGDTSITLVTSPLHTRRACAAFERVGFRVTCIAAAMRGYSVTHATSPDERLRLFREWLYELSAWQEYRWRGWS